LDSREIVRTSMSVGTGLPRSIGPTNYRRRPCAAARRQWDSVEKEQAMVAIR
jgi:hypothetical protein